MAGDRSRSDTNSSDSTTSFDMRKEQKELEAEEPKKLPYPKSVFFIVGNEFCERFSYYGMKAILSIYFKSKLHFSEDSATVIYHTFSLFCYFTPIFGAMIADQLLGKFKTIVYISVIYVLGHVLKTMAAVPTLGVPPVEFSLIGLALIAIGTGGIKPCVSAFGGDQFKLPEQERQLQTFFSVFYFAINSGSLLSTFMTPILREDVGCFGDDTCYSLAFGIPALLMFVATVILIIGRPMYVMKPPQGNIVTKVVGSIVCALKNKMRSNENRDHWMDHAREKYGRDFVEDVKDFLKVIFMYLPLPVFWALFDQQGSRWTFQATRMNGDLGFFIIKPDQMQLINPALILILIPTFESIIYPFFAKFNFLVKPLQRIAVGGLLTALAFVISGLLELSLMQTYDRIPIVGESHVHLMNSLACPLEVRLNNAELTFNAEIGLRENHVFFDVPPGVYEMLVRVESNCADVTTYESKFEVTTEDRKVSGVVIRANENKSMELVDLVGEESPKKAEGGATKIRAVFDLGGNHNGNHSLILKYGPEVEDVKVISSSQVSTEGQIVESDYIHTKPGIYRVFYGLQEIGEMAIRQGGVHTVLVSGNTKLGFEPVFSDFLLTPENSVHMLWLIPQYFVITTGEIMFSVTGLEFSYSQAPESMKSVLQAAWLLTVAFGNLIVIGVAESRAFSEQASEFFMFAGLMFVDMIIFSIMAYFYKYVDWQERENDRKRDELHLSEARGIPNDGFGATGHDHQS